MSVFSAFALLAAGDAHAADRGVRSVKVVQPKYPLPARDAGHQGTVRLSATILVDGTLADVKIVQGSGSDILDASAREAFAQWKFEPPLDDKGVPRALPFDYDIPFYKLPLINATSALATFPCRDFVADVSWFEATFPGKPRQEVRDYQTILAPIMLRTTGGPRPLSIDAAITGGKAIRAKRAALDAALVICRAMPDMLLIEAIARAESSNLAVAPAPSS